jgi:hypothetical protein
LPAAFRHGLAIGDDSRAGATIKAFRKIFFGVTLLLTLAHGRLGAAPQRDGAGEREQAQGGFAHGGMGGDHERRPVKTVGNAAKKVMVRHIAPWK